MTEERRTFRLVTITVSESVLAECCDLRTAAELSGISSDVIRELCYSGFLQPRVTEVRREEFFFDDDALYHLRMIHGLMDAEGINLSGVRIILDLKRQLDRLERELKFLRDRRV